MTPRRSTRKIGKNVDYSGDNISLFPDGPPMNELESTLSQLNSQAFPGTAYARVDDILVQALFRTKRDSKNYRALVPATAGNDTDISNEEAIDMANILRDEISQDTPTREQCRIAALHIWVVFHEHLHERDLNIMEQFVFIF
jgi:tRNA U54 and U55 pseudouridine synthase Pus10